MEAVLLVIHLIVAISIIVIVLIQPSEAGGFMGVGGGGNAMAPRRSADLLTRLTTILAGCFFLTSLFLAILAGNTPVEKGILEMARDNIPAAQESEAGLTDSAAMPDAVTEDITPPAPPQAPVAE